MSRATLTIGEKEIRTIVKESMAELLLTIGINVSDPDDAIEYQKDRHYVREQRLRNNSVSLSTLTHGVNVVLSGILAAIVLGVAHMLFGYRG